MNKQIHQLFLLSFIVCAIAKVEWKIEQKISAYGEDLRLLCIADNYAFDGGKIKRWEGGPKQKMLTLNGAPDQEDVMKYKMSMLENGFDLVINNVTKADLNVTYDCTYGFNTSGKVVLKIEDAFEVRKTVKPSKVEREGTNTSKVYVIPFSVLAVVAVIVILLIILHCKGKLKDLKGKLCGIRENEERDQELGLEEKQETGLCLQQPNGYASHHSNGGTSVSIEAEGDELLLSHSNDGNSESIIDVPFESYQRSQTELITEEPCNTDHDTFNYTSVKSVITPKDTASCFFTEVNECDLLPQQHEECTDFPVVPLTPHQSELVTSVTESKTLEQCNTNPDGESADETPLKGVTAVGDTASPPTASVPGSDFQFSISNVQYKKKCTSAHAKYNPAYKNQNTREKSFKSPHCNWTLSQPSIQQMAKAGFFCNGYKSKVQCYSCGKKSDWQEGDDPFDEIFHENCRHLKYIKQKQTSSENS
ncbi:uncharacterized protein LOC134701712 [Mytilus trossulus]|uniref:uncharacterized protein LOC134701712 n=1 Tax=Mytilus trossulus TaxID=6551 RepID=UPI003005CAD5